MNKQSKKMKKWGNWIEKRKMLRERQHTDSCYYYYYFAFQFCELYYYLI